MLGTVVADAYEVVARLAQGGMGALYKARHLRLERDVALKVLHPTVAEHEIARERFRREARAAARIAHPNVAQVLDVVTVADGRRALVVELLEGQDLQKRLENSGPLDLETTLRLAVELGRGVQAAHDAGVVHRDLKPSNVFLAAAGAKIIDFGVAALDDDDRLTRTGAVVGTPAYMAPEQVRGAHGVHPSADIYALGAIVYRCLAGVPPYDAGSPTATLAKILDGPPPPLRHHRPDLPHALEALVFRAMEEEPERRFASAATFAEAAEAVLHDLLAQSPEKLPGQEHIVRWGLPFTVGTLGLLVAQDALPETLIGSTAASVFGVALASAAHRLSNAGERSGALAWFTLTATLAFGVLGLALALAEHLQVISGAPGGLQAGLATAIGIAAARRYRSLSKRNVGPERNAAPKGSRTSAPSLSPSRPATQESVAV